MNNIFDFATKELSQDAFLSWFISNCNEDGIKEYSYEFIKFITKFNFKVGDIKKVQIKQQENNMDIIVDFWTSEDLNPQSHYVIIIEDKTTSSAHSGQLKRYAEIMNSWNTNEPSYKERRRKVFYKVSNKTKQDELEIEEGDNGFETNDRWRPFYIDDIYKFFSKIPLTKSEILNSYVEHIKQIYNDLNIVSDKPMSEWNYNNYVTFFKKVIKEKFSKKGYDCDSWSSQYQGRLVSFVFCYRSNPQNTRLNKQVTEDKPCFAYPLVEFIFKKYATSIVIYSHISYHWKDDDNLKDNEKWSWKPNSYKPSLTDAREFMELLKKDLNNVSGIKVRKMNNEKDQTISSDSISLKQSNAMIEEEILYKLSMYFRIFKSVDEKFNKEKTDVEVC